MAVLGLSREVRVGLIAILVPIIVLLDDNHAPLAGVEEAPLSTPSPLLGGSEESYWAAGYALAGQLPAHVASSHRQPCSCK